MKTCTICRRTPEEREAIEKALLSGEPLRTLGTRYGTSATSLWRHKMYHLPASLAKAHEAGEAARADSLMEHVRNLDARAEQLYQHALAILEEARASQDPTTAVKAIREATGVLKQLQNGAQLRAKLSGEMPSQERDHPNVSARVAFIVMPAIKEGVRPVMLDLAPGRERLIPAPLPADAQENP
jgi:superfamily I DNA/RNA helicase